jgi:hypothetical protein
MPKLGTIQHIKRVCRALAQSDYTRHSQVTNTIPQLAVKCGLSKGPSMLYYDRYDDARTYKP